MRRLSCVFGGLLLAAVGANAALAAGEELRFRLNEDPETLYNAISFSLTVDEVLGGYVHDRLVYIDRQGQPQPWLAKSWQISDDQKEVTFELREGIKFQDGTDVDAEAFKIHFDSILDPAKASPLQATIGSMSGVEVVGPLTLKFVFDTPFAPFFNQIAQGWFGPNSPTAMAKWGNEYGRHPIGTGPYMVEEWIPGSEIRLVRNPYYKQLRGDVVNKGAPLAERIVLTVIPEEGTAMAALETGELTAAQLQADSMDRFANDPNFKLVIDKEATNLLFVEFNYKKPPFDDIRFREAISHAIDRDAAVVAAWGGYASPVLGPLANGIPGYDPKVGEEYGSKFDLEKAKALLTEAGWTDTNSDGILDKNGEDARFLIKSFAGYTYVDRTAAIMQDTLKDLGIAVETQTTDWGALYPSLFDDDWGMTIMRWTWPDPVVLNQLFRSPGHREKQPANPKIDDVLDRCSATLEPVARAGCVSEAQKVLLEDVMAVPILTNWAVYAAQADVQDFSLDFMGYVLPSDVWIKN